MKELFDIVSRQCSKITTLKYSTSFSLGIKFLARELQQPIYNIYGFVRFADEIVDSFHGFDKAGLLNEFRSETYQAIKRGISLNPILNSFQETVNKYQIDLALIDTFLDSMEMDLHKDEYNQAEFEKYILGSAEVVGLMCLRVFVRGNDTEYERLKRPAMQLGSAFQKINFLRDLQADYQDLGRSYFPNIDLNKFDEVCKEKVEDDIEIDFKAGFEGIKQLPKDARFGVYLAYKYYFKLFKKIRRTSSQKVMEERIRLSDKRKYAIFLTSLLRHQFNLI